LITSRKRGIEEQDETTDARQASNFGDGVDAAVQMVAPSTFEHYDAPSPTETVSAIELTKFWPLRIPLVIIAMIISIGGSIYWISLFFDGADRHPLAGFLAVLGSIAAGAIVYTVGMYFVNNSPTYSDVSHEQKSINQQLLGEYHKLAKKQAASSFRVSQVVMLVGFAVLIVGSYVVIRQAETASAQIVVGGLAAIGAAFSSYISATFIRIYNQALAQLNFYYIQPLVQNYIDGARLISVDVSRGKRDAILSQIIEQTLKAADAASKQPAPAVRSGGSISRPRKTKRTAKSVKKEDTSSSI
jgi:hypothetical protein